MFFTIDQRVSPSLIIIFLYTRGLLPLVLMLKTSKIKRMINRIERILKLFLLYDSLPEPLCTFIFLPYQTNVLKQNKCSAFFFIIAEQMFYCQENNKNERLFAKISWMCYNIKELAISQHLIIYF